MSRAGGRGDRSTAREAEERAAALIARRHIMTLYSGRDDPWSHRSRIVLYEKEVECQVVFVDTEQLPAGLADLNPYNRVPTMVDRDLVLYESHIINEYLDERLPHPPLMPIDPIMRARARLMLMRFDRDWYSRIQDIETGDKKRATQARAVLRDGLTAIAPVFKDQPFALGTDITLVDCTLAALLWRLPLYGIELPRQGRPLLDYADRLFKRSAFQQSLTENERDMRPIPAGRRA